METIRPAFNPGRNEPCFCDSGQRFKHCCGSQSMERNPPHGIQLIQDFLSPEQCQQITRLADEAGSEKLKIIKGGAESSADEVSRSYSDTRVTDIVRLGDKHVLLKELTKKAFSFFLQNKADSALDWYENPQLLKYTKGSHFKRHTDCDYFDQASGQWKKGVDRDLSLLMYINDGYEGGELYFDQFNYTLRPKSGMLVVFPSDFRYTHEARTVSSGTRYAIASWAKLKSSPMVRDKISRAAIKLE